MKSASRSGIPAIHLTGLSSGFDKQAPLKVGKRWTLLGCRLEDILPGVPLRLVG
jgi:hypothetical protein